MPKTLKEIASLIDADLSGDGGIVISGANGLKEAQSGDISFVGNRRYMALVETTKASAVIVPLDSGNVLKPHLKVKDPSAAFAKVIGLFHPVQAKPLKGIHKTAVISRSAKIGRAVALGPYVVIEDDCCVADNTIIHAGCFLGHGTKVGRDCIFYANVSIRENIIIGDRVFIQSGSVIGSEGFGYVTEGGTHRLIPQVGIVVLEDDVEVGANVTIDRARFGKTIVGRGTKIDNLVQIAHNVVIGENCLIVAQAGISGSTRIGNNVIIAGQAGLVGHIEIGDGAILGAQAGITKSIPAKTFVSGYPARPHHEAMKIYAATAKLPELLKEVQVLKKRIEELDAENNKK